MVRLHSTIALLALLGSIAMTGCNSFGRKQADAGNPASRARSDLKNPSAVFLAYGRMQERQGLLTEARESYGFVLKEKPESRDAMLGMARLDQLAGRSTEAEQRYQQVAEVHPNDPVVLEAIGQFLATEDRWDEAVPQLRQAAALAPDQAGTRFNLAIALAHTGAIEPARKEFQSTVGVATAHYNLGHILMEAGRHREAERELIAAIAANPDLEEAQTLLGELRGRANPDYRLVGSDSRQDAPRHEHAHAQRTTGPAARTSSWSPEERPTARKPQSGPQLTAAQREQLRNQSGY